MDLLTVDSADGIM